MSEELLGTILSECRDPRFQLLMLADIRSRVEWLVSEYGTEDGDLLLAPWEIQEAGYTSTKDDALAYALGAICWTAN